MLNYLIRRLLLLIPVFLAVSVVIFTIIHLVPGDPIDNMVQIGSSPEQKAALIARYGLDQPLLLQYGVWFTADVRAYADKAYQECLKVRGLNCEKQFNDNNFNVNTMNTVDLFGRDPDRDGRTTGFDRTQLVTQDPGLDGGGQGAFSSPSALGAQPRAPANAPLPVRGSAPASVASPFSLN